MQIIKNIPRQKWSELCKRPEFEANKLSNIVDEIFSNVKLSGDDAIKFYTEKFDGIALNNIVLKEEEFKSQSQKISVELKTAIQQAKINIEKFHMAQIRKPIKVETAPGVFCWQEYRPIQKVGLYVPGGSAPLFSTVLMLAIPAKIAGCKEIVLCTPPNKNGNIPAPILYAAQLTGVTKIIKAGGIQAIAAMTYGTKSVPKVFKIFGPGNQYVTQAKQKAFSEGTTIDFPAGPSEVLVLADNTANPEFVAADLLSQAEHGPDSQVVCLSNSLEFLERVIENIELQLSDLPRKEIARNSLNNALFLFSASADETIDFINEYAPEHLIISVEDETPYLKNIQNAGSVFVGNYSPESAGDYLSGTNHTLPTNGNAKSYGSLGLDDYIKKISFQRIEKKGLVEIGNSIQVMANAEGLEAHAKAVAIRLNEHSMID